MDASLAPLRTSFVISADFLGLENTIGLIASLDRIPAFWRVCRGLMLYRKRIGAEVGDPFWLSWVRRNKRTPSAMNGVTTCQKNLR